MEASGTSGMKVAANGGLNISVLDGWWAEGYEADLGWAIGSGESYDELEYQNAVESHALYDLLEKEVVPLFYDRGSDGLPRKWLAKMKATMGRLAPMYNTNRMVRQYAEMFYSTAVKRWDELTGSDMASAKEFSAWKKRMRSEFGSLRVEKVTDNMDATTSGGARVGKDVRVEAVVNLGRLTPADVTVELYFGPLDEDGQLSEGQAVPMEQVSQENERVRYGADMPCSRSGMTGYTVRVMPRHPTLLNPRDMAMTRWA
jgi:starch phosphorylase